jgi:hypothetical protein
LTYLKQREKKMADYYSLGNEDLQELLKTLPSDQGEKLKERLVPILDYLVWTGLDAKASLEGALAFREVKLSAQQLEELLNLFLGESFECDATTERVNNRLDELARDFLDGFQTCQKHCRKARSPNASLIRRKATAIPLAHTGVLRSPRLLLAGVEVIAFL